MPKFKILLVDDDDNFRELFVREAEVAGRMDRYDLTAAADAEAALASLDADPPDVVVTDVEMPGLDGMTLFQKIHRRRPDLPVIILTAFGSVAQAVQAVKGGAFHYFDKPLADPDLFWHTVSQAASVKRYQEELDDLRWRNYRHGPTHELIGESPAWQKVLERIRLVAPLDSTVLITGQTGTGKEVAARAIHTLSQRADRPFVASSCAEFAQTLLETELFGHERGSFTGAVRQSRGIFERAHGGTLFLDEIAETAPDLQVKLLRVLDGAKFFRVGGQEPLRADFRLIAATNRDMEREVTEGRFRSDLYYRLNVYPIHMPTLAERREDVLPLARHFMDKISRRLNRPAKPFSGAAVTYLTQKDWPGNVRELENLVERAVITSRGEEIAPDDFLSLPLDSGAQPFGARLEDMERIMILLALDRCGRNKAQAARMLGIARKTLGDKMRRYGLE